MTLVNKTTGQAWPAERELSFYHGYDDGYWSEGNKDDDVVFADIPAGTYYLEIDPDMATDKADQVRDTLEISTPSAGWSNFVFLFIFVAAFPIFTRLRHTAFEVRRWSESDHPMVSSSDDDSDDDD
jgi:hypothetical protein